jgi:choline dehydrogenase-like flavoprotein
VRVPEGVTTGAEVTSDVSVECEVVIVGSGAGGATMAAELAEAGVDVVVVEEGGYHSTGSFTADSMRALRTLYRDGGGGMAVGRPSVLFAEGRCVGGSTVVNGGMSWRTPERVLERWSASGILALDEQEMQTWFARAEARHSVGLQDPETIGRDSELMRAGAAAKGWAVVPNRRAQLHCAGTNNCTSGCPTGAKRSMLVTSVPRALALGARLYADCRVDRVTRAGRAVTGLTGHFVRPGGRQGPRLTVRAGAVIVAAGAIQTPALLARSGVRPASGQLGRNLSLHPNTTVVAFFDSEVTGWHGVHQAFQVREYMAEGLVLTAQNLPPPMLAGIVPAYGRELGELMADYNRIVTAGPLVSDTGTGRVRTIPGLGIQVFYRLTDADAARLVRGVELTAEALFAAGARRMLLPFDGAPEVRSPDALRALLARPVPKASMQVYSIHLMGTARMSEDPRRGVTDSFGAVHGVPGLFVADASLFPGPIGINPMETVVALAMRNARRLVEKRMAA